MAVTFITVLNGVVTGRHHGDINALFAGPFMNTHERVVVEDRSEIRPLDLTCFYTAGWRRKTDAELVAEGLVAVPAGLKLDAGGAFGPMTAEERVTAGLATPEPGFKAEGGRIAATSWPEKAEAGLVSREEYAAMMAGEAEIGLNRRLALPGTGEAKAMAEVDGGRAAPRREKLPAPLAGNPASARPGTRPLDCRFPFPGIKALKLYLFKEYGMKTPLAYYGGKQRLSATILSLIPEPKEL
jgi:hypothetical protein